MLNKSLLGSCLFLFVVFILQLKICFGSIPAAFRKASKMAIYFWFKKNNGLHDYQFSFMFGLRTES